MSLIGLSISYFVKYDKFNRIKIKIETRENYLSTFDWLNP